MRFHANLRLKDYGFPRRSAKQVPLGCSSEWQNEFIDKLKNRPKAVLVCRQAHKPLLVVTELLSSMTERPVPTRAEVSDICHAVWDGAEHLMLTNETAAGKYPTEAAAWLVKCARAAMSYR